MRHIRNIKNVVTETHELTALSQDRLARVEQNLDSMRSQLEACTRQFQCNMETKIGKYGLILLAYFPLIFLVELERRTASLQLEVQRLHRCTPSPGPNPLGHSPPSQEWQITTDYLRNLLNIPEIGT
jgi:hypothetical protein